MVKKRITLQKTLLLVSIISIFSCVSKKKTVEYEIEETHEIKVVVDKILVQNPIRFQVGYQLLTKDEKEDREYGLFSYLLFSQKPDENSKEKYLTIVETFLNKIPTIESINSFIAKDSLNISYIPVLKSPISGFSNLSIKDKSKWILANYDYGRAKVYLGKVRDREVLNKGPYIVSYRKPLLRTATLEKGKYLLQDFSKVHPKVVSLWVDTFITQSSKLEFWNEEKLKSLTNNLRNTIAVAAEGLTEVTESLSWWKEKLKSWISSD